MIGLHGNDIEMSFAEQIIGWQSVGVDVDARRRENPAPFL
jgi:hypothetical protein